MNCRHINLRYFTEKTPMFSSQSISYNKPFRSNNSIRGAPASNGCWMTSWRKHVGHGSYGGGEIGVIMFLPTAVLI